MPDPSHSCPEPLCLSGFQACVGSLRPLTYPTHTLHISDDVKDDVKDDV